MWIHDFMISDLLIRKWPIYLQLSSQRAESNNHRQNHRNSSKALEKDQNMRGEWTIFILILTAFWQCTYFRKSKEDNLLAPTINEFNES